MAASVFTSPFRFLTGLITSPKKTAKGSPNSSSSSQQVASSPSTKRKADDEDEEEFERPAKRRATSMGRQTFIPYPEDNDETSSPYLSRSINEAKAELDRSLMPPPATPHLKLKPPPLPTQRSSLMPTADAQNGAHDDDSISFVSTALAKQTLDPLDNDVMEEARRHAAAITLPPNSGIWSPAERELFFHLAYRGFEPLLPENWMLDFDTLPLSVFANENSTEPPLIHNVRNNQFRASNALHQLFEAGHNVRDRSHVSPGVQRERILEKSVKRYLYWALTDVGIRPTSRTTLPVHVIVSKRRGLSTLQTLEEVATKLQKLSDRHQRLLNVHPSIEPPGANMTEGDETRVADEDDTAMPTLIGFVIISSLLVIVTLSPFATAAENDLKDQATSSGKKKFDADRLRIIAELDFSQKEQDVWNAFGVAIAAMQIRREALKASYGPIPDDMSMIDWDMMSTAGSRFGDDLEDFSPSSRPQLPIDDPDL